MRTGTWDQANLPRAVVCTAILRLNSSGSADRPCCHGWSESEPNWILAHPATDDEVGVECTDRVNLMPVPVLPLSA